MSRPANSQNQPPAAEAASSAKAANGERRNFGKRVITALVAAPAVLATILLVPGGYGLLAFSMALSVLAMFEYLRLLQISLNRPAAVVTFLGSAVLWAAALLFFPMEQAVLGYLPMLLLLPPVLALALLIDRHAKRPFQTLGLLFLGVYFIVLPFVLFYASGFVLSSEIAPWEAMNNPSFRFQGTRPVVVLVLTWMADTAAYFGGKRLGRHKLWVRISPKKTWEGAAIGLLATVSAGALFEVWLPETPVNWIVVALIVMPFGLLGDLLESLLKRSLGAKESGGFLPGHGGILDRFDGLLVSMPVLAFYFYSLSV